MKILIGTPCYGGVVTTAYMKSLLQVWFTLEKQGIQVALITPEHESLITRGRNVIANHFMRENDCTHLLFIDADIGFGPDAVLRLVQADKDVACGVYPAKVFNLQRLRTIDPSVPAAAAEARAMTYTTKLLAGVTTDANGFVPVEYAATGFMMIRREVLARMAVAFPQLKYRMSYVSAEDGRHENVAYFDTMIDAETGENLPEDYSFCRRWRSIGGEIHVDTHSRLSHTGTHVFAGDYQQYLEQLGAIRRP
jgi:hypothetical protein